MPSGRGAGTGATPGRGVATGRPAVTRGPNGRPEAFRGRTGNEAHFDRGGRLNAVHARGLDIRRDARGARRIEREDHSRVFVNRAGHGYVQRSFNYRGREFAGRTYYYNGRSYAVYYQRYAYHGVYLEGYLPAAYYAPAFYGWAYNPWAAPVPYTWGFVGAPWYGTYGYFFAPYPVYPSASLWLTDYLISQSLATAYQEQAEAGAAMAAIAAANSNQVVVNAEVKQAVALEVQRQLALENAEAQTATSGGDLDPNSSGLPRMLAEATAANPRVFVVAAALTLTDAAGQECAVSEGDVLRLSAAPPPDVTSASLEVYASKDQECARGDMVAVDLIDLQEMQNHMRATIDTGLKELQAHRNGLPSPPPSAAVPAVAASFASYAPPADPNVAQELTAQSKEADGAEQEVLTEAQQADPGAGIAATSVPVTAPAPVTPPPAAAPTPASAPIEITLGQTIDQVTAAMGPPQEMVKAGAKTILVYPKLKITFMNGKVSDVQ